MTRYEFYDARLAHWMAEADPRIVDPEFQALRDIEAAQAAGVKWDSEPKFPKRLQAVRAVDCPSPFNWHLVPHDPDFDRGWPDERTHEASYQAAAAAYNREHDNRCKWPGCSLPGLCQSGNFGNRLVCAEHFTITNGSASTGGDDLPNPEPDPKHWLGPDGRNCALCGKPWPHEHTPEQLAAWEAKGGARGMEPAREWPETLTVDWRLCGALGEMPMLYPSFGSFWPHRHRMGEAYQEAARRWEDEPKLRQRIDRAFAYVLSERMRNDFRIVVCDLQRILTGKES